MKILGLRLSIGHNIVTSVILVIFSLNVVNDCIVITIFSLQIKYTKYCIEMTYNSCSCDLAQKCGPNEYFDESGPPCIRTSENPRPKCLDTIPEPACVCNTGFVRNRVTGRCEQLSVLGNFFN